MNHKKLLLRACIVFIVVLFGYALAEWNKNVPHLASEKEIEAALKKAGYNLEIIDTLSCQEQDQSVFYELRDPQRGNDLCLVIGCFTFEKSIIWDIYEIAPTIDTALPFHWQDWENLFSLTEYLLSDGSDERSLYETFVDQPLTSSGSNNKSEENDLNISEKLNWEYEDEFAYIQVRYYLQNVQTTKSSLGRQVSSYSPRMSIFVCDSYKQYKALKSTFNNAAPAPQIVKYRKRQKDFLFARFPHRICAAKAAYFLGKSVCILAEQLS